MFVCVTPNGSLDLTLRRLGTSMEIEDDCLLEAETAGGKGHNVARFLADLGHEVVALGFAGGWTGARLAELLAAAGVEPRLTPIRELSRFFVSILEPDGTRMCSYRQPGPPVTPDEERGLLGAIALEADRATTVVLAGGLPPGASVDFYARAIEGARPATVVLDTSGPPLRAALEARPDLVKVNARELASLTGAGEADTETSIARIAASTGIERWWVTSGASGAVGWDRGGTRRIGTPSITPCNTSGAGDAFLAGLLHAEASGLADPAAWAVATAAAVAEQPAPIAPAWARIESLRVAVGTGENTDVQPVSAPTGRLAKP